MRSVFKNYEIFMQQLQKKKRSVYLHVRMSEADLPGDASVVPSVALQVCAAQPQLFLQLLPQLLRRRLQPELLLGELKRHDGRTLRNTLPMYEHRKATT